MSDQQATFDDLPVEIVLMVFHYLNTFDTKKARSVSKAWNELLSSSKFIKNEILKLEKCLIAEHCEPMKSLMKSSKEFHQVEIGQGIEWEKKSSMVKLFNSIGRKCRTLILNSKETKFETIFEHFEHIEKLIAPNMDLITDLCENYTDFPPDNLKEIESLCMPPLKDDDLEVFGNMLLTTTSLNMAPVLISSYFYTLIEKQKGFDYRDINYTREHSRKGFESLLVSPGKDTGCFFTYQHKVHMFPNMRSIEFSGANDYSKDPCQECFATFLKSCLNIEEWIFTEMNVPELSRSELKSMKELKVSSSYVPLEIFSQQTSLFPEPFQKLEVLSFTDCVYPFGVEIWLKWPQMPRLRELRINSCRTPMEQIVKASPGLRILVLHEIDATFEDLKTIIEGLPYLQRLSVAMAYVEYDRENMLKLLSKGLNLQTLQLHNLEFMEDKDFVWELFCLIPTLHETIETETVTRADYERNKSRM